MSGFEVANSKSVAEREDEGTVVNVRDAAGDEIFYGEGDAKKAVTITVAGSYSKTYRRALDAQRERMMKQRRGSLTAAQLAKQQLELTAACVIGWQGFLSNGQPYECSKENVIALLDSAPWVRDQVEEAMQDHQSFFSTSSAS